MVDTVAPELPVKSVVYGLKHRPRRKVVYVGSTARGDQRWCEHINLTSGCRRVAIALSRENVQPILDHFELEALWEGVCTSAQRKAIEQVFMDRHDTRVYPRPTNGVTKDIDLFNGSHPDQLNIIHSCTDDKMLKWARMRVQSDSAIVVRHTPSEERKLMYELEEIIWNVREKADSMACNKSYKWMNTFQSMDPCCQINIKDIHAALNEVFCAIEDDDGCDIKRMVQCYIKWFNVDSRGHEAYSVHTIVRVFQMLSAMSGMQTDTARLDCPMQTGCSTDIKEAPQQTVVQVQMSGSEEYDTADEARAGLMQKVVSTLCTDDENAVLRPLDVAQRMKALARPLIWSAIGGPSDEDMSGGAAEKGGWSRKMLQWFSDEVGRPWVDKERQYNGSRVKGRHMRGLRFAEIVS